MLFDCPASFLDHFRRTQTRVSAHTLDKPGQNLYSVGILELYRHTISTSALFVASSHGFLTLIFLLRHWWHRLTCARPPMPTITSIGTWTAQKLSLKIKPWVSARRDVTNRFLGSEQEVNGASHASTVVLEDMLFPRVPCFGWLLH